MKKWETLTKVKSQKPKVKSDEVIKILLENRGVKTKKETEEFLNPKLSKATLASVKINSSQVKKSVERIKRAIKEKEQIVVYGDYDVDGICGSAILWETLNAQGAKVTPYIPHRIDEGYGLSERGIQNLSIQQAQDKIKNCSLIITVDNGIVANKAVDFAKKQGIDVIITDHHVPSEQLPRAFSIVHTTLLCGAGVAYMLSKEFKIHNSKFKIAQDEHLALVALATVSDLVPLLGANRTLLKHGLLELHKTKRLGLLALFKEAQINQETIGVYEIGHIIAPRLNAMGRLESAMDSLRLVCTTNKERATDLAHKLGSTNTERRNVTDEAVADAKAKVRASRYEKEKLLFIADESYEQGVIGLVAGRLVEEFYIPSIVVSKGKVYSKASARSVSGFNIIEFIRSQAELLVDVGGHPMAAGFTVETAKLALLEKNLKKQAGELLDEEMLQRSLKIDMELPASAISQVLYDAIQKLQPFGMKNPEPTFLTRNFIIEDIRLVGNDGKHLKIRFMIYDLRLTIEGIAFGMGEGNGFKIGDKVDVVYNLSENEWNGNKKIELKIKDLKSNRN
ncbi:MAG: single-stranded-DNA-specific exonuclease RecJ [Patescibacteria group bacterium]|nr:single-stranded-DNA-specific exonuclease RecJ [Patescibacteria group bacterium]